MTSINKVILVGRLGRDPEMRFTPGGDAVTNFSIATNRRWKDAQGEQREQTEWHNLIAWRKIAEQANQFLLKGRLVYVEGHLETRSWDDKDTAKKMYRTEIVIEVFRMLDTKAEAEANGAATPDRVSASGETYRPSSAQGRPTGKTAAVVLATGVDPDRYMDLDDTPF